MRRLYFLPILCLSVFLAGCFPVKIHADDPFFTVGHTYRTAEECFLIFLGGPYDPNVALYPVSRISYGPRARERVAELREKKDLVFEDCNPYNGRVLYVPAGTEFRVDEVYRLFPNCLEGNTSYHDITLSGEFGKYKPVSLVTRIQAIDVTPGNDGADRLK